MLTQIGEFQRLCHINRMEDESLVAALRHDWHQWFLPKVAPLGLGTVRSTMLVAIGHA